MQRPPIFVLLFISIFGFIGVAVLIGLWSAGDGFGAPPLIFKLVGSFIALAFICMGFGLPISLLLKKDGRGVSGSMNASTPSGSPAGYACPNCGGAIGDAEVSPSGDVKCEYCRSWWNIHRA